MTITKNICVGVLCLIHVGLLWTTAQAQPTASEKAPPRPNMASPFVGSDMPTLLGIYAGFDFSSHTGSFVVTDTGGARSWNTVDGDGTGLNGGLCAFVPLMSGLYLSPRLGIEGKGGVLTSATEDTQIKSDDGKLHDATLQRAIDISMRCMHVDLMLAPIVSRKPFIYLCGGLSMAIPLQKSYFTYENIVNNSALNYSSGTPSRNIAEGTVDNVRSPLLSVRGGAGALFVLRKFILQLELLAQVPLSTYTSNAQVNWKSNSVVLHIGLLKLM